MSCLRSSSSPPQSNGLCHSYPQRRSPFPFGSDNSVEIEDLVMFVVDEHNKMQSEGLHRKWSTAFPPSPISFLSPSNPCFCRPPIPLLLNYTPKISLKLIFMNPTLIDLLCLHHQSSKVVHSSASKPHHVASLLSRSQGDPASEELLWWMALRFVGGKEETELRFVEGLLSWTYL
ncbi:unnamed protein product [Linum trigynum]|uniref:Uncharacterized protein n=1 Tax=Linum trigynum TaxID=586398 RepID=A0AAV2E8E5_9ROSI